jgi:hypothetical protein
LSHKNQFAVILAASYEVQGGVMTATHVRDAVQECVYFAAQSDSPTTAVFTFVRTLMDDRGWSEVDAREVGARALVELDNSQSSR